jgi:transposase InsO family protein
MKFPALELPAVSTTGEILKRHGLVRTRRTRSRAQGYSAALQSAQVPNAIWGADFKGDIVLGNGHRCHPLTLTDVHSRYLLRCQALERTASLAVEPIFESAFREYGLPDVIRTDNGPPFASHGGLSPLSIRWIKLGILPERIEPGRPQQNGRHERMHRTLKAEAMRPPRASLSAQQRAFDAFRDEYNNDRPHEALGQTPPAEHYRASTRPYPSRLPELSYPAHYDVRRVSSSGKLKLHGEAYFLSWSLGGENVALEPIDDGLWAIHFGRLRLGSLDERTSTIDKRMEPGLDPKSVT